MSDHTTVFTSVSGKKTQSECGLATYLPPTQQHRKDDLFGDRVGGLSATVYKTQVTSTGLCVCTETVTALSLMHFTSVAPASSLLQR